jgi:hypothetical protein
VIFKEDEKKIPQGEKLVVPKNEKASKNAYHIKIDYFEVRVDVCLMFFLPGVQLFSPFSNSAKKKFFICQKVKSKALHVCITIF